MSDKEQISFLIEENRLLREIIVKLDGRIAYLEEQLRQSKVFKNSSNSSKPP